MLAGSSLLSIFEASVLSQCLHAQNAVCRTASQFKPDIILRRWQNAFGRGLVGLASGSAQATCTAAYPQTTSGPGSLAASNRNGNRSEALSPPLVAPSMPAITHCCVWP